MPKFKPRPIADPKYQQVLLNMGIDHGWAWDCQRENCPKCEGFRIVERKVYDSLSEQEKHEVRFTRYGI